MMGTTSPSTIPPPPPLVRSAPSQPDCEPNWRSLLLTTEKEAGSTVAEISLHQVTRKVREQILAEDQIDLDVVADFLGVAARLMALKSRQLLPAPDVPEDVAEEGPVQSSVADLLEIRAAVEALAAREGQESYPALARSLNVEGKLEPWPVATLKRALADMGKREGSRVLRVVAPAFMRLEVALSGLLRHLRATGRVSVRRLLNGSTRQDVVIHFLAILELMRRRQVVVSQERLFDEITINWAGRDRSASDRAG